MWGNNPAAWGGVRVSRVAVSNSFFFSSRAQIHLRNQTQMEMKMSALLLIKRIG